MPRIKLTSISTPFGGLSWEFRKSDEEMARALLAFLEDRRVLRGRLGHAGCITGDLSHQSAVKSVSEIRQRLRDDLEQVDPESAFGRSMRSMQRACRAFLTRAEAAAPGESYTDDLDALAREMSDQVLRLGERFGYAIESLQDWGGDERNYREAFAHQFFANNEDIRLVPADETE